MKIQNGQVEIAGSDSLYVVTVHLDGTISSLGVYPTFRQAIIEPLENERITQAARSFLEAIRATADAENWDTRKIEEAFPFKG